MSITHAAVAGPLIELTDYQAAHTIAAGTVTEAELGLTDVTTANVTTSAHGLAPKAPNDATKYLDGTGAYSAPTASVTSPLQGAPATNATGGKVQFDNASTDTAGSAAIIGGNASPNNDLGGQAIVQGGVGDGGAPGGKITVWGSGGNTGGAIHLDGGQYANTAILHLGDYSDGGTAKHASFNAEGISISAVGGNQNVLAVATGNTSVNSALGTAGNALLSDGSSHVVWGGVIVAAGVPSGAPNGSLPFAVDTTAGTGGFYYWNSSAWVEIAASGLMTQSQVLARGLGA